MNIIIIYIYIYIRSMEPIYQLVEISLSHHGHFKGVPGQVQPLGPSATCMATFSTVCRKLSASACNVKRSWLSWWLHPQIRKANMENQFRSGKTHGIGTYKYRLFEINAAGFFLPPLKVLMNLPSSYIQHWRYLARNQRFWGMDEYLLDEAHSNPNW